MKTKFTLFVLLVPAFGLLAGCGPSREEIERRERARLEQEKRAQEEIRKSNEAVNEVSKKLGRKPPAVDLGLPATKTQPAPQRAKQP